MEEDIKRLIEEGNSYTFNNNCYKSSHGIYSRPSVAMQAWIGTVEDLILNEYGKDSAPYKMYSNFVRKQLDGNYQDTFDKQKDIILSALHTCLRIVPKQPASILNQQREQLLFNLFDKFHSVARQLRSRYNSRETIDINDEYDVQDLLHALLKLYFEDVRSEEWAPSYAGGSSRMDFLLKEEKIIIEVKKTRKGLGDRELGSQLIEDKARYSSHPDCKKIICFVYDPEGRISNPKGLENDLNEQDKDFDVKILIRPSI